MIRDVKLNHQRFILYVLEINITIAVLTIVLQSQPSVQGWRYMCVYIFELKFMAQLAAQLPYQRKKSIQKLWKQCQHEWSIASSSYTYTNFNSDGLLHWISFYRTKLWNWKSSILACLSKRLILSKSIRLLRFLIQICGFSLQTPKRFSHWMNLSQRYL